MWTPVRQHPRIKYQLHYLVEKRNGRIERHIGKADHSKTFVLRHARDIYDKVKMLYIVKITLKEGATWPMKSK